MFRNIVVKHENMWTDQWTVSVYGVIYVEKHSNSTAVWFAVQRNHCGSKKQFHGLSYISHIGTLNLQFAVIFIPVDLALFHSALRSLKVISCKKVFAYYIWVKLAF